MPPPIDRLDRLHGAPNGDAMVQAVCIQAPGGAEQLEIEETGAPTMLAHQVRVRVAAAGLNRADILQRRGLYPAPEGVPAQIPGLEFAGEVIDCGAQVARSWMGERVMGIVGGAAMSTEVCVDAGQLLQIPAALSFEQAAALPEAFITAFDALIQAQGRDAKHILVHAAASGVGTAVTQIASHWNIPCSGTSRSKEKLAQLSELGLTHAIVPVDGRFVDAVDALNESAPDVIIDLVGGGYAAQNLEVLASRGRIMHVGLVGGRSSEVNLGLLLRKRASMTGTVLRSRARSEKRQLCESFRDEILPAFSAGAIRPVIDKIMPMTEIQAAHRRMEANQNVGKIVLAWDRAATS